MRLHVLSLVHSETTRAWSACAYTQRTMDFCSFMTDQKHEVILYGGQVTDARVAENVAIITRAEQAKWFPGFDQSQVFNNFDVNHASWQAFNLRAAIAIRQRAQPKDIVCVTMGITHKPCCDALSDLQLLHVETGIGYAGVWAPYRVFESVAWRHYMAAKEPNDNLRWYDEVIPRGYFAQDFPLGRGGREFLFMGRLTARKGAAIAADACKRTGARLLIAGQGVASHVKGESLTTLEGETLLGNITYLGVLNPKERADVMGNVAGVFMPTWYLEPGGGVAIEAQLCGTPVITTPYGAMTETVVEGKTGYHCSSLADFVRAAENVETLDRETIRKRAIERFSAPVVAQQYDRYFKKLSTLYGEGWYANV